MMNDPASLPIWGEGSNNSRTAAGNRTAAGAGSEMSRWMNSAPLAMVYSPKQTWGATYDPSLALQRGTLFPELDKPWEVEEGCRDD